MKIKIKILLILLSVFISNKSFAQYYGNGFGLSIGVNYTKALTQCKENKRIKSTLHAKLL